MKKNRSLLYKITAMTLAFCLLFPSSSVSPFSVHADEETMMETYAEDDSLSDNSLSDNELPDDYDLLDVEPDEERDEDEFEIDALSADDDIMLMAMSADDMDLGTGTGTQQETNLQSGTVMAIDSYLSDPVAEVNNQDAYKVYLEQGLFDPSSPVKRTFKAPRKQNIYMLLDQSSSLASDWIINHLNDSTAAFFERVKQVNDTRMAYANAGLYSDIDPSKDVAAQMKNHLIYLNGIVGFNNHAHERYHNASGLLLNSSANVATAANAAKLKNDYAEWAAAETVSSENEYDIQIFRHTNLGFETAENWINSDGTSADAYVLLISDGFPLVGWPDHPRDIPLDDIPDKWAVASSDSANKALRSARRIKDKGSQIECIQIKYKSNYTVQKAAVTGDIRDVSFVPGSGLEAVFMSLCSSDYPKNGVMETWIEKYGHQEPIDMGGDIIHLDSRLTGAYKYESDARNGFGKYTHMCIDVHELDKELLSIPSKIDGIGQNSAGYASMNSYVQNVISQPFELTDECEIRAYKVPRIPAYLDDNGIPTDMDGNGIVSSFRWGRELYDLDDGTTASEWEDITNEVSISVLDNTVKVSGFDYERNALVKFDKDMAESSPASDANVYHSGDYGYKLVVVLRINAKTVFGGKSVATNGHAYTNFYPGEPSADKNLPLWITNTSLNLERNPYLAKYPELKVDLNIDYAAAHDNMIVYAPQTALLENLVTNARNYPWQVDDLWYNAYEDMTKAKVAYEDASNALQAFEESSESKTNKTKYQELQEAKKTTKDAYDTALATFNLCSDYTPDGLNNQFVDITYTLKDPNGTVIGTLDIPHGTAYTGSNLKWSYTEGPEAIIKVSGVYSLVVEVTPVTTTASPIGLVYTGLDSSYTADTIGYSSTAYSSTGSVAGQSTTMEFNPEAYVYQLKITVKDTRLVPRQSLDFNMGNEDLMTTDNPHIAGYEWICTDRTTPSEPENEPGISKLVKIGIGGPVITNTVPEQAYTDGRVIKIMNTDSCSDTDGSYVPIRCIVNRSAGNINKSADEAEQGDQKTLLMLGNDNLYGEGYSSVIWEHVCDNTDDCDNTQFTEAQSYSGSVDEGGPVQYLIHVDANPKPEIHHTNNTSVISVGDDILWNVTALNRNETENPRHNASDFSLVDILPWNGDSSDIRIDPITNIDGSQFSGDLYYKSVVLDLTDSPTSYARLQSGDAAVYYTTETAVRNASESQILGKHNSGNITWIKSDVLLDDDNHTAAVNSLPNNVTAIKVVTRLGWNESLSMDMSVNVATAGVQKIGDRYHNKAVAFNGNGGRFSEVTVTRVSYLYISGTIWEDFDSNGLMGAMEERIPNVKVTLYKEWNPNNGGSPDRVVNGIKLTRAFAVDQNMIPAYLTGTDGVFEFDNVQRGTFYIVADQLPEKYTPTKKGAGTDNRSKMLDSECEESLVTNTNSDLDKSVWIKQVTVDKTSVPNMNMGLGLIRGSAKVWISLDEIYFPTTMTDEEMADYQLVYLFNLKHKDTGNVYKETVRFDRTSYNLKNGKPQVYAEFDGLPLGTYVLTEGDSAQYKLDEFLSMDDNPNFTFNDSTKEAEIKITTSTRDFEIHAKNTLVAEPPGGDVNGMNNWVNVRVPVDLEIKYVGPDPVLSNALSSYKFVYSDFDPAKGGDMIVTYDDGTKISLSEGTLRFEDVALVFDTVTNVMNSGINKVGITGYYAERGHTVNDSYRVGVNLKPIHKFKLIFDANGSVFSDGSTQNVVYFSYDEFTGHNYVTMGDYKDAANGYLNVLNGFRFTGWNTQYDGLGVNYDSLSSMDAIGKDPTIDTLTLYARWTTDITFHANGGTIAGGTTAAERALAGRTYGTIPFNLHQTLATGLSASKTYHRYLSWNSASNGKGTAIQEYGRCTGPMTFYAIYYQTDYPYTGYPQVFVAPLSGVYSLHAWGGRGAGDMGSEKTQHGGYATGRVHLNAGDTLYVIVGGAGEIKRNDPARNAYNGGGADSGSRTGAGGGGATHIAKGSSNQLYQFGNPANAARYVYLVAGGSGGLTNYGKSGGSGGGTSGGNGRDGGRGGTQTSGYAFGKGEDSDGETAGGGGGWYGGYRSDDIPSGGGGGSGWLNPILSNASMENNVESLDPNPRKTAGYARIIIYSRD